MDAAWNLIVGVTPSVVDLHSAFALLCTSKGARYTDAQWAALAASYCPAGFWEAADTRPKSSSEPLFTWRAELERVVRFDAACVRLNGSRMSLAEYVGLWVMQDRTADEYQRVRHASETSSSPSMQRASLIALAPCFPATSSRDNHCNSAMAVAVLSPDNVDSLPPSTSAAFSEGAQTRSEEDLAGDSSARRVRARLSFPPENGHASWLAFAAGEKSVDHLALLYPHARDAHCWMDEIAHRYYVHGEIYPCSVSGVWKVFFPVFDDSTADMCIRSAEKKGIKSVPSSVYNLAQYLRLYERINPADDTFWVRAREVVAEATKYYELAGWVQRWEASEIEDALRAVTRQAGMGTKPPGKDRCYFLALCAGCKPAQLKRVWKVGGALESFKGTYLHKQAELFMQELGAWQLEQRVTHTPLRELLANPVVLSRARAACSPECTMASLVAHVEPDIWDLPATQEFFFERRATRQSPEYLRFEAWLQAHPALSPYRSEWSIYNEDRRVAGQVDSLWFDTKHANEVVMADWKRAKELLTADATEQRRQCYGKTGLRECAAAPGVVGPCADMMDCSYNHYTAQQHLYAYFLKEKYDVNVRKLSLVQCHPDVGETDSDYNEAVLEARPGFAGALLDAFDAGWKSLL